MVDLSLPAAGSEPACTDRVHRLLVRRPDAGHGSLPDLGSHSLVVAVDDEQLGHAGAIEPQGGRGADLLRVHGLLPSDCERAENTSMPASCSPGGISAAVAVIKTACAVPAGTWESKMTIPAWGRSARLRECRAAGAETQKNSR